MKLDRKTMGKICELILFTVLVVVCCFRFEVVVALIRGIVSLFTPFLLGLVMAFIVNLLMRFLERVIFENSFTVKSRFLQKIKRPVSIFLAWLVILGLILAVLWLVIPSLGDAVTTAIKNLESAIPRLKNWLEAKLIDYPEAVEKVGEYLGTSPNWALLASNVIAFLKSGSIGEGTNEIFSTASAVLETVISWVPTTIISVVFACYLLSQKEKLKKQASRLLRAFLPDKGAEWLIRVYLLSARIFSRFITGQCLEACILFLLYFAALGIGGFPYAVLIAVMVAFMSFIPFIGCYLSCAIGALLILTVSPFQALVFVIVFAVIQQIEGNLIYPHVVGGSVGLPGIWVLVAVSVGGTLFGIMGMLVFIPLTSVIYSLLREEVHRRIKGKEEKAREAEKRDEKGEEKTERKGEGLK